MPPVKPILSANVVELVLLIGDLDLAAKLREINVLVHKGELHMNGAVEVVEEIAPTLEDGVFVLI